MARKSRVSRLLDQYGINSPEARTALATIADAPPGPTAVEAAAEPEKTSPDWEQYREAVAAGHVDVGSPLDKPRTTPPNACQQCGSAKVDGRCRSGCDGLTARVIPQSVGRGRRSR